MKGLNTLFCFTAYYWIGGSDEDQEGTWTWVSTWTRISPETFQNWMSDEPDGDSGVNCVCLGKTSDQWSDKRCTMVFFYVCEM